MTAAQTCREADCGRMVCRAQRCRPCFLEKTFRWTITEVELRSVPLGRLSFAELHLLRKETRGEGSIINILKALMKIAPRSLTTHVTEETIMALEEKAEIEEAEELAEAEHYDPEPPKDYSEVTDARSKETVRFVADWLDEEYDPQEAMRDDLRGPDFYDL